MPKLETKADTSYQLQLPKVSFRVIDDEQASISQTGVKSEQCRSYGFNDFSEFVRPEHYIRYIEPIESELAVQVEYDMDEQDQEWLDSINAERQKEQSGPISYEIFEIIMDKLEKEWFNLIKRIPQPASHLPVEDSRCSICDDGEGENSNAIVFCDGCNLAVHQDCYGVPYIPEGQWLCRKCTVSPEHPVSCIFCPNEGGAFKKTTTGHWSHLLCAIWIPELTVGNAIYMEPVQDVELLPKSRWKLVCSLCQERVGACIQCENKQCFTAFHVTCARQAGQLMTMKTLGTEGVLKAFCDKHLPADMRHALDSESESEFEDAPKFDRPHRRRSVTRKTAVTTKTARAHAKAYRPGPPIVPRIVVNSLLEYVAKVSMRKKQPFVERLCRYWSLKREARRGAPLLKRLHLEPWTASSTSKDQSEEEKAVKLKFLTMLRNDLDKVRMLAELTRKREKEKLKQAQVIKDIVDSFVFPAYGKLRLTLQKISAMDRQDLFLHFVSRVEVPDYYQVITEPMCWMSIDEKIEKNEYRRIEDFKHDIDLVLDNALKYNAPDSTFHRIAKRIQVNSRELLAELDQLATSDPDAPMVDGDTHHGLTGDLEPSRHLLQALLSRSGSSDERDRLANLFAFELEPPKEPTPPPPPPPEPKKRDTHVDRKKRWEEKEARRLERLETGRSTRAGQAKEEAFQHEAGLLPALPIPAPAQNEAGPSIRRTRQSMGGSSSQVSKALEPSTSNPSSRPARSQVGVAGREVVERLSDKERRAREQQLKLEIEAVGNSDQFTRFNTGWILPEGSSRRRPNDVPVVPLKPRVTKAKAVAEQIEAVSSSLPELEAPSSPLSAISARDSSLSPISSDMPSPVRPYPRRGVAAPSPLHQSTSHASPSSSRPSRKRRLSVETDESTRPAKTPRPAPTNRRSRLSTKMEVEAFLAGEDETAVEGLVAGASDELMTPMSDEVVVDGPKAGVHGSQLTENDDVEAQAEATEDGEAEDEEERFPPGTLVWAKQQGYPYFPAEVVDPEEERLQLSPQVFKEETRVRAAAKGSRIYLVNFFDKQNTYGWISEHKLDMLGVNDEIDTMYLALKERGKKSGKTKQGPMVKEGYRQALAALNVDGLE